MKTDLSTSSKTKHILFCVLLTAAAVYLLLLCSYSSIVMDEAFFLTIPLFGEMPCYSTNGTCLSWPVC